VRRVYLDRLTSAALGALDLMRTPRLALGLWGYSLLAFLAGSATNWLVSLALSGPMRPDGPGATAAKSPSLPYGAWLLLLAVLQISAVVPIPTSPGRIGLFHYLCVMTLAIFGTDRDVALAYGLLLHAVTYLPMAVGGPLGLWIEMRAGRNVLTAARTFAAGR
jgi:uncharacterized membrane protein YbhN (UPF0104 family)